MVDKKKTTRKVESNTFEKKVEEAKDTVSDVAEKV
jgi:hypothetical protein